MKSTLIIGLALLASLTTYAQTDSSTKIFIDAKTFTNTNLTKLAPMPALVGTGSGISIGTGATWWKTETFRWVDKNSKIILSIIRDTMTVFENDTLRVINIRCKQCKIIINDTTKLN